MRTNNAQGRLICIAVSGFMLAKCILNSVIGGGFDAGEFGKALLCGIFLIESLSVIIQKAVFKLGKRPDKHMRVWRRTPIHHHFCTSVAKMKENDPLSSVLFKDDSHLWAKPKIVLRFCIITLILAALTILTLKIR